MSIQYELGLNKLTVPPSYSPRVRARGTTRTAALAAAIARSSTMSEADVLGVLIALSDQIITQLLAGNSVQLDGIGTITLSLKGRVPGPVDPLPADSKLDINFRAESSLREAIQSQGSLERVDPTSQSPLLLALIIESGGGGINALPGGVLRLQGDRLKVTVSALDEGVFLINNADGSVNRVTNYLNNGDKELLFVVPEIATGPTYTLEVRNRRTGSIALRTTAWPAPLSTAA